MELFHFFKGVEGRSNIVDFLLREEGLLAQEVGAVFIPHAAEE